MKKAVLLAVLAASLLLSGCAGVWEMVSIGKMNGKMDEDGLNYEDTGVAADPFFLYANRKSIRQSAIYPNEACRDGRMEKYLIGGEE